MDRYRRCQDVRYQNFRISVLVLIYGPVYNPFSIGEWRGRGFFSLFSFPSSIPLPKLLIRPHENPPTVNPLPILLECTTPSEGEEKLRDNE